MLRTRFDPCQRAYLFLLSGSRCFCFLVFIPQYALPGALHGVLASASALVSHYFLLLFVSFFFLVLLYFCALNFHVEVNLIFGRLLFVFGPLYFNKHQRGSAPQ